MAGKDRETPGTVRSRCHTQAIQYLRCYFEMGSRQKITRLPHILRGLWAGILAQHLLWQSRIALPRNSGTDAKARNHSGPEKGAGLLLWAERLVSFSTSKRLYQPIFLSRESVRSSTPNISIATNESRQRAFPTTMAYGADATCGISGRPHGVALETVAGEMERRSTDSYIRIDSLFVDSEV